jgi:hypothetical protein
VILDEHIGLEGLPDANPGAARAKDELKARYISMGFQVYGGAYSEHMHTVNAVPHILNFGSTLGARSYGFHGVVLNESSYFEAMRRYGYSINILQSDYAELCSAADYASCTTYWSHSLKLLRDQPLTAQERAYLIIYKFLLPAQGIHNFRAVLNYAAIVSGLGPISFLDIDRWSLTSTVGALRAFDVLNEQLVHARPGELYFMHALAPHYPYLAQKDCRMRAMSEWEARRSSAPIQIRQNAYFEQIACVTGKIEGAVRALSRSPAKDNFVVIVHGDHGSRITNEDPSKENLGTFSDADMVAGFSTLFAVKGPGIDAGYSPAPAPVAVLLRQWAEHEFRLLPAPEVTAGAAQVYLDNLNWQPTQRHALPQRWLEELAAED